MDSLDLKGMVPAAVMPMDLSYEPDYQAFRGYIEWLIAEGAIAVAVNMDTGEGPQLTPQERHRAVSVAAETARGRAAVLAGVSGSTTANATAEARACREVGADGVVVFPNAAFRNEPLDPRIPCDYHRAIGQESGLPIVLFQLAPVFGGVIYSRETLLRLFEIPQVVGIKEASFDAECFARTKAILDQVDRPITLLTGNDRFIGESILLGATGALLGFAAVGCRMVAEMLRAANAGRPEVVAALRPRVQAFAEVIYADPVLDYRARCKVALAQLGVIPEGRSYVRPPMLTIDDQGQERIRQALVQAGMFERRPA
jgi:4-hydroxy-tetrahydrodipicolinate synthase